MLNSMINDKIIVEKAQTSQISFPLLLFPLAASVSLQPLHRTT